MKKVQRSFAVEYKSGRRKTNLRANSIWGDMDLKSVARDVQEEAMPFPNVELQDSKSRRDSPLPEVAHAGSLTRSIGQQTNASATREKIMADEINTITSTEAQAIVEAPTLPKKQRKPRTKKVAAEAVSVEVAADPAVASNSAPVKQKRGRKAKSIEVSSSAKLAPVKRAPRTVPAPAAAPMAAIDEMAALLQLEEENQRLRKLLAEKLRAENADLRKRLKLD
ncbi:transcriptional regulator [Rhizobium herbae]